MTASSFPLRWDVVRLHHRERCAQKPSPIAGSKLLTRNARRELYDIFCNFVGSVRSPLLANLDLHGLDSWGEERHAGVGRLYRSADDLVGVCRTPQQAVEAQESIGRLLEWGKRTLQPDKTRVVGRADEGLDVLGGHFHKKPSKRTRRLVP
jgi:hypothetical protein